LPPKTTLTTLVRISVVAAVAEAAADAVEADEEEIAVAAPMEPTPRLQLHLLQHNQEDAQASLCAYTAAASITVRAIAAR
jgi:hypothetical protein